MFENKKAELKKYVNEDGEEEYDKDGIDGIPTYDLCDNDKYQDLFSLKLDINYYRVYENIIFSRAPVDILSTTSAIEKQKIDEMRYLQSDTYASERITYIQRVYFILLKLFTNVHEIPSEEDITLDELALSIYNTVYN